MEGGFTVNTCISAMLIAATLVSTWFRLLFSASRPRTEAGFRSLFLATTSKRVKWGRRLQVVTGKLKLQAREF